MLRVEIEWLDSGAHYNDGWEGKDAILAKSGLSVVSSCGYLMHESDDTYYVATTYDKKNEHFYGLQLIAKSSVKSVTVLRARRERDV